MAVVTTPDGVDIVWSDLGGRGPDLLLAHATGFCGAVWGPIAQPLREQFRVVVFDERGHGASGRAPDGNYDWAGFATDALSVIDAAGLDHPFAVGHSCGAALLLLAEQRRPGTFRGLWCYEPIAFPSARPAGVAVPLAIGARRRRAEFASRAEALANFSGKPPLNVLDPEVLAGYIKCGFVETPDGVRLACEPEDEARTYEMGGQHDAFDRLGEVRCPVWLACGELSDAITPMVLAAQAERLPKATTEVWTGHGHFGLLADPARAATSITAAFASALTD